MKFAHQSDTHGSFLPIPKECEFVVHSGDFFPNAFNREQEVAYQTDWMRRNLVRVYRWLQDRPLLYVPGNHDFVEVGDFLEVIRLNQFAVTEFRGLTWAGLPYVSGRSERWMYTEPDDIIEARLMNMNRVDMLVTHGPPRGILDLDLGSHALRRWVFQNPPTWHLFGHIHEKGGGFARVHDVDFSNAASTTNTIVC